MTDHRATSGASRRVQVLWVPQVSQPDQIETERKSLELPLLFISSIMTFTTYNVS